VPTGCITHRFARDRIIRRARRVGRRGRPRANEIDENAPRKTVRGGRFARGGVATEGTVFRTRAARFVCRALSNVFIRAVLSSINLTIYTHTHTHTHVLAARDTSPPKLILIIKHSSATSLSPPHTPCS